MNKTYRVVWNEHTNTWIAVQETAKARGKSSSRAKCTTLLATASMLLTSAQAFAATVGDGTGQGSIIVKGNSVTATTAAGQDATAIGTGANALKLNSIAIGKNAQAGTSGTVTTTDADAIAIGSDSVAYEKDTVALGNAAKATADSATALGKGSKADSQYATAVGLDTHANGNGAVAMGSGAGTTGNSAVAVGNDAKATQTDASAFGHAAQAKDVSASAFGHNAQADAEHSVAVGSASHAQAVGAIAIGNDAQATEVDSLAHGKSSRALGERATAVGNSAQAQKADAVAVGNNAQAQETFSVAVGTDSIASASTAVALGAQANASNQNAIAAGFQAAASATDSLALGKGAQATHANSVALGADSESAASFGAVGNVTVNGITYSGFAADNVASTVSVGKSGSERAITNVGAGRISATSTDAINGSQLYLTQAAIGNVGTSVKNILGGNAALGTDGNLTMTNIGGTGKNTIHEAIQAANNNANAANAGFKIAANGDASGITADNKTIKPDETLTIKGTGTGAFSDYDSDNIQTQVSADGTVTVGLKKDLTVNSVTAGDSKLDTNGLTITGGPSVTKTGIDAAGNKITNVADGTIGAGSQDAINGGQLHTALNNINNNIAAAKTEVTSNDGSVSIAPGTNGAGATVYDLAVKTDGTTITKAADGSLKANTTALAPAANGSIAAPSAADAGKLATAGDIANAINSSGFKATAGGNTTGAAPTQELIKAGDTLTLKAGSGLTVEQTGSSFTYALNAQQVVQDAQTPVVYTKADGSKVYKHTDGNFYDQPNGAGTRVAAGDVIVSMQGADGSTTATPATKDADGITTMAGGTTLNNVASAGDITNPANAYRAVNAGDLNNSVQKLVNNGFKIDADNGTADTVKLGETVKYAGDGSIVTTVSNNQIGFKLANTVTIGSGTGSNPVKIDGTTGTVTGLTNKTWNPAAITSGRAATEDQLKAVADAANSAGAGFTIAGNSKAAGVTTADETIKAGETLSIKGTGTGTFADYDSSNIQTQVGANGEVTVGLKKDLNVNSVTAGDSKLDTNGLTITGGPSVTKTGIDAGSKKITNVADGTIGAGSKDAINGGQLHTALNNINTNIAAAKTVVTSNDGSVSIAPSTNGAGATVYDLAVKTDGTTITKAPDGSLKANTTALTSAANGSIVAPAAADAGKLATAGDIANAINQAGFNLTTTASAGSVSGSSVERVNAGKTVTIDAGKNIRVTQTGNTVSIATQDNASFDSVTTGNTKIDNNGLTINGGPSVTQAGIDAAGNKITNVAPGTDPTDAVNVSQLNARLGATGQVAAAQLQQLENKIDQNQDRANAGIAGAIAQGTIPQVTRPSAFGLGVGTGYYGGQSALAVGASAMTDGGNWIFKGNFSVNTKGRVGAGAGALYQW